MVALERLFMVMVMAWALVATRASTIAAMDAVVSLDFKVDVFR